MGLGVCPLTKAQHARSGPDTPQPCVTPGEVKRGLGDVK